MEDLAVPVSYAGIITMIISAGTIISSLFSDFLARKFSTGVITTASVFLTAVAIFGFSVSTELWMFIVFAIPCGIGAGAVDAALNNYVALHYSSKHMNWLHCFWGVGVTASPFIMGYALTTEMSWSGGYKIVAAAQLALAVVIFFSIKKWKKPINASTDGKKVIANSEKTSVFKIKGVVYVMMMFFTYCAMEATVGLWATTYLSGHHNVVAETAAILPSLFYIGITVGRFISGFFSDKVGDKRLIRVGIVVTLIGILCIILPMEKYYLAAVGLAIVGLGCAPIYPAVIHATPSNFGAENSGKLIGIQMASAYTGTTLIPPIMGVIAKEYTISFYPYFLLIFCVLLVVSNELLNRSVSENKR